MGYSSSGPEGRVPGFIISTLSDLALKGMAMWASVQMVLAA